jgi:hypothetical protein
VASGGRPTGLETRSRRHLGDPPRRVRVRRDDALLRRPAVAHHHDAGAEEDARQESAEKKSRGMVRDPRVRTRRPTRTDASAWWADGGVRLRRGGVVMRPCLDQRPGND